MGIPNEDKAKLREYNRAEVLIEMAHLFELAAERPIELLLADLEMLDAKQQLALLHDQLVKINLMPRPALARIHCWVQCVFLKWACACHINREPCILEVRVWYLFFRREPGQCSQ